MSSRVRAQTALAGAVLLALSTALPAQAADNGFGIFWKTFTDALRRDDKGSLAGMVVLANMGDWSKSFAVLHANAFGPKQRACLIRQKPVSDNDPTGDVGYSAFCQNLDYEFTKSGGVWKLTDIGPND